MNVSALRVFFLILLTILVTGCATSGRSAREDASSAPESDSLEPLNRSFYNFNETLDQYFMRPVAEGYVFITPAPLRAGVTNFFNNVMYLNVVINSFLQGKPGDGLTDISRFVLNSTLGLGGLLDVASDVGIERHEEDTGQTLAVWGVGQGSYLYLPLFGPNTVRNLPDFVTSYFSDPLSYLSGAFLIPVTALNIINLRASLLRETELRDQAAVDGYVFTREAYLQRRYYLIYDGNPPVEDYNDMFEDFPADGGQSSPQ